MLSKECKYVVKEKRCLSILLTTFKFLLMIMIEKILMKKNLMKKILMKEIVMKNIKYRICLAFLFLTSQIKNIYHS